MTDREFFNALLEVWRGTTRAESSYWETKKFGDQWCVYSVGRDDSRVLVGTAMTEQDADFIVAVHGALPDMVRRLHSAVDEADRLDAERDEREQLIADLARKAR